jgi:hypothetical protein
MILQDLFEGRMKDFDIAYQDWLDRRKMTDRQFLDAYNMTRLDWAKRYRDLINNKEAHQRPQPVGDEHLFRGSAVPHTVHEGAMSELHADLSDVYNRLAPGIERNKDSFKAGELYDALEAIAIEHGAELEFKRMMNGARNRAHMDYDTNPGGFQNWFWYLPFADEDITEESQDDRNARIIAGEIEDAMNQGRQKLVQQKIKELINVGYTLDKDGNLQRMGMYEESELQEKQDACYHKVKSRYKVWPSAYASGALVQCRKKGAANWGTGGKKK